MIEYDFKWMDYPECYHYDSNGLVVVHDDACQQFKDSYNNFLAQKQKEFEEKGRYFVIYKNEEGLKYVDENFINYSDLVDNEFIKVVKLSYQQFYKMYSSDVDLYISDCCYLDRGATMSMMNIANVKTACFSEDFKELNEILDEAQKYGIAISYVETTY